MMIIEHKFYFVKGTPGAHVPGIADADWMSDRLMEIGGVNDSCR
jgi:hypothetical protein